MKCFQTSALENLWKALCVDPLVCQVLSCEVRAVGFLNPENNADHKHVIRNVPHCCSFFSANILIAAGRD